VQETSKLNTILVLGPGWVQPRQEPLKGEEGEV